MGRFVPIFQIPHFQIPPKFFYKSNMSYAAKLVDQLKRLNEEMQEHLHGGPLKPGWTKHETPEGGVVYRREDFPQIPDQEETPSFIQPKAPKGDVWNDFLVRFQTIRTNAGYYYDSSEDLRNELREVYQLTLSTNRRLTMLPTQAPTTSSPLLILAPVMFLLLLLVWFLRRRIQSVFTTKPRQSVRHGCEKPHFDEEI